MSDEQLYALVMNMKNPPAPTNWGPAGPPPPPPRVLLLPTGYSQTLPIRANGSFE